MPLDQVRVILKQAEENGRVELNAQGELVGAVLSLNPTQHQISMDNQHLYAWCAYDAMYTPGVVGEPAQIVSVDPLTGGTIRISITPDRVETVRPESAVVSVVDPGGDMSAGPESTRCTHMLFFESRESAEQWMQNRTGVSILTIEEVFELAKKFQIKPARRLGIV
jgi:alkylmercury lyase